MLRLPGFDGFNEEALPYFSELYSQFRGELDKAGLNAHVSACGFIDSGAQNDAVLKFYLLTYRIKPIRLIFSSDLNWRAYKNLYVRLEGKIVPIRVKSNFERGLEVTRIIPEKLAFDNLPVPKGITSTEDVFNDLGLSHGAETKLAETYTISVLQSMIGSRGWKERAGGVGVLYFYSPDYKQGALSAFSKFSDVASQYWFPQASINRIAAEYGKVLIHNTSSAPSNFVRIPLERSSLDLDMKSWDLVFGRPDELTKRRKNDILDFVSNFSSSDLPLFLDYLSVPRFPKKSQELMHFMLYAKELVHPKASSQVIALSKEYDSKLRQEMKQYSFLGQRDYDVLRLAESLAKGDLSLVISEKHVIKAYALLQGTSREFYETMKTEQLEAEYQKDVSDIPRHLRSSLLLYFQNRGKTLEQLVALAKEFLDMSEDQFLQVHDELHLKGSCLINPARA